MRPMMRRGAAALAVLTLIVVCAAPAQVSGSAGRPAGIAGVSGSAIISYHAKWNMVSTPYLLANDSTHATFPPAVSNAFRYAGGYAVSDVLTPGTGYWIKFQNAEDVTISGTDLTVLTVNLVPGWNLIGSISTPVAVANITTPDTTLVLSPFFRFAYAVGYVETDTIFPGYGYWVFTDHAGSIMLTGTTAMEFASGRPVNIQPCGELPPAPPVAEEMDAPVVPDAYLLAQSYPNPFNPSTTIRFELPAESRVTLTVHDMLGRPVATLYEGIRGEGVHSFEWNAGDRASGMYFYRLTAVDLVRPGEVYSAAGKMVLTR
jgi:hypothetical protein